MTITQPDLWAAVKDEAIDRADNHADESWKHAALVSVRWCAHMHPDFTADEVWHRLEEHYGLEATHEPSAIGPVFLRAARAGVIRKTGELRPSTNKARHRDLTVWTKA